MTQRLINIRGTSKGKLDEALTYIEAQGRHHILGYSYVSGDVVKNSGYSVDELKNMRILDSSLTTTGHTTNGEKVTYYAINWAVVRDIRSGNWINGKW